MSQSGYSSSSVLWKNDVWSTSCRECKKEGFQGSSRTTSASQRRTYYNPSAISGGKDSAVLLERIHENLGKRRDVTIVGGCVDEGIEGYRPPSLECARELCEELGIRFETVSYPELGFKEMDEVVDKIVQLEERKAPCSYCGVFRRQGINHLANRVNADVIALGHNSRRHGSDHNDEYAKWRFGENSKISTTHQHTPRRNGSENRPTALDSRARNPPLCSSQKPANTS